MPPEKETGLHKVLERAGWLEEVGTELVVVGRANQRLLLFYLGINLLLLAAIGLGETGAGRYYILGPIGLFAALQLWAYLRPPRITVGHGVFTLQILNGPANRWSFEDVTEIEHDVDTVRISFANIDHVQPSNLRAAWKKQFLSAGHHVELVGPFTGDQIDQVRDSMARPRLEPLRAHSLAEFNSRIRAATPHVFVTPTITVINLTIFAALLALGQSHVSPHLTDLVTWGANFGPLTLNGQPWRLLTAAFLHAGALHLLVNVLVLWQIGPLVERLYGNFAFAVLYLIAGIWGSLASVCMHPMSVAVGASGAIFGLYGALGALLLRHRHAVPRLVLLRYRGVTISFVAINVLFGFSDPQIDVAAHMGGLLSGFVLGLLLTRNPSAASAPLVPKFVTTIAGLASVVIAASMLGGKIDNVAEEFGLFGKIETQVNVVLQAAGARAQRGELADDDFAALLESEVIEPWSKALDRLAGLSHVPEPQKAMWSRVVQYAKLRKDGWQLLAHGLRTQNQQEIQASQIKFAESEAAAKSIAK